MWSLGVRAVKSAQYHIWSILPYQLISATYPSHLLYLTSHFIPSLLFSFSLLPHLIFFPFPSHDTSSQITSFDPYFPPCLSSGWSSIGPPHKRKHLIYNGVRLLTEHTTPHTTVIHTWITMYQFIIHSSAQYYASHTAQTVRITHIWLLLSATITQLKASSTYSIKILACDTLYCASSSLPFTSIAINTSSPLLSNASVT
jgi:hypothetical protein